MAVIILLLKIVIQFIYEIRTEGNPAIVVIDIKYKIFLQKLWMCASFRWMLFSELDITNRSGHLVAELWKPLWQITFHFLIGQKVIIVFYGVVRAEFLPESCCEGCYAFGRLQTKTRDISFLGYS